MDALLAALRGAAEPTRLRIVALLAEGELTVSELVHILGQSQPRISRHLKLLAEAGLLTRHREGSWVFHRLSEEGLAANPGAEVARHLIALLPDNGNRGHILALDRDRLAAVKTARAEAAADYFDANAESWDSLRSLHVDDKDVETVIGGWLGRAPVHSLLDIGTGTGRILEVLSPVIERGVGIDQSREMLAVARANLERGACENCQVRQADLYRLPFDDGAFDAAVIHQVLHFLDEPAAAIAEAARVLTPGGHLVVADFLPHVMENLRDEHSHRRLGFADDEIRAWVTRAGLTSQDATRLAGDPLTVGVWLAEKPKPADTRNGPQYKETEQ
ncbi:MAG: metalloregulator ArsR/SmtB family transcription factor [Rhodospirillales bacterium]|nr:metalloregulator ArsR/SmtB family transcription factor [Alphaproteobacteria bacterium]MBL6947217.1 metalloregulator ArsR/SmtB family transcription factor [Rhodospirillales bacterium]